MNKLEMYRAYERRLRIARVGDLAVLITCIAVAVICVGMVAYAIGWHDAMSERMANCDAAVAAVGKAQEGRRK